MPHKDRLMSVAQKYARDLWDIDDLDELLWYIADTMVAGLGFGDCVVYRIDRRDGCLVQVAAHGDKTAALGHIENPLQIPIGHGLTGFVAMTGEPLLIDDVREDARYVADLEYLRSEVTVPIVIGPSVFGVIDCESPKVAAFDEHDLLALTMVATLVAPKIEMLTMRAAQSSTKRELIDQNLYLSAQLESAQNAARAAEHSHATVTLMQLSGGVAHDFNNQLAVMRGALDMALHRVGEVQPDLAMIGVAVDRATELTHRLLAFSSQQTLFPHCINLSQVVSEMQTLLQVSIGNWIALKTSIAPDLWNVNIDLGQLENAILNIAVNARDAMADGGILKISCYNAELDQSSIPDELDLEAGQYVVLSISDQGAGMTSEVRTRAFEPYFTTKTRGSGTGLGLSMVYGFVRQSGGDALLTSVEGEGTSVKLYFPRDRSAATALPEPVDRDKVPKGSGEMILVIEDNRPLIGALGKMLEMLNYQPLLADSASDATSIAERHPELAAVLSDVLLEDGISGIDVSDDVLAKVGDIPVIFMSGYADLGKKRLEAHSNRGQFLQKPFSLAQLASRLEAALAASDAA